MITYNVNLIESRRFTMKLTKIEMAKLLGRTRQGLYKIYANDYHFIDRRLLAKLSKLLKVEERSLITYEPQIYEPKEAS